MKTIIGGIVVMICGIFLISGVILSLAGVYSFIIWDFSTFESALNFCFWGWIEYMFFRILAVIFTLASFFGSRLLTEIGG